MNEKCAYLAAIATSALMLGGYDKMESFFGNDDESGELIRRIEAKKNDSSVNMLPPDSAQLSEQGGQAMANIQTTKAVRSVDNSEENSMDLSQSSNNDPFYESFRRLVSDMPDMPEQDESSDELNFGSDLIISQDGYVLTNTYVVANMANIKVSLNDKRAYSIELIGSNQQSGIALIKIDTKDPPMIKIDSSKDLKPGKWVAAIGTPFGFDNSITADIVFVKGCSLPNEDHMPLAQTDVAINPDNPGGSLFNLREQVVGINSQIYSRGGGFMGISFATLIDVVMNVADQIKKTGEVQRGRLGMTIQETSYDLAKSFGLDKTGSTLVVKIMPNSPTAWAGLQVSDIVRNVNGGEVRASSDLPVMVGAVAPGKEVRLGVRCKSGEVSVKVQFGSVDASVETGNSGSSNLAKQPDATGFIVENTGLTLQVQNSDNKQYLIITRITGVTEYAGLERGDEVLAVSQITVDDESTFCSALENAGKNMPLSVRRDSNTLFLVLNP